MQAALVSAAPAPPPRLLVGRGSTLIGRQDLPGLPTPPGTSTHRPIPHAEVIQALIETLAFRRLAVQDDSYAVSKDGSRLFGVLTIDREEAGVRFAIGVRNSHDKSFALALTVGYRVLVCDNLAFHGEFSPVLRRHTPGVLVADVVALGIERCQRAFPAMTRQIEVWKNHSLPDDLARLVIYRAFIERSRIELPRHLGPLVHDAYFDPPHEEFRPRTLWSLGNAFTHVLKALDPIPRLRATAALAPFLTGAAGDPRRPSILPPPRNRGRFFILNFQTYSG